MDAHLMEFLGMLVRWLHVIAGVAWIGSSFYFIWLDNSLEPPTPGSENAKKGVSGDLWAVHGGGFYNPQKYAVAPASLPEKLHWFKWEAYTTWLSGTALLVLVYWLHAQTMMVDANTTALAENIVRLLNEQKLLMGVDAGIITGALAIGIGAGSMLLSWFVYDGLCRSPLGKRDGALGAVVMVLLGGLTWALCHWLGGRAAYIHVGTSIGTIMAANVFFIIIPGQKKMVEAMRDGKLPDPIYGKRGKQRSVHNNYFTLPVIFIMISNHYAATYGHPQNWAVLLLIAAAAVSIRHFFNRKHKGVYAWQFLGAGALILGFTAWWTGPHGPPPPMSATPVSFGQVQQIVAQRCVTCHMAVPTFPGITQPPAGVLLNNGANIAQNAGRIYQQVAVTRIMPLGNVTQITEDERAMIARWVHDGSKTN